jgi:hypothetical protein
MTFNDHRLEAFARNLALGMPTKAAARAAQFTASTAHSKAHIMAKRPAMRARVAEIRSALPQMGFGQEAASARQPAEPPRASAHDDAVLQPDPEEKLATDRPSPALLAPGGRVTREWLTSFLQVVAGDAIVARDRRTAIAAADLLAKVNGLHAPQPGPAASLAHLDAAALQRLLTVLDAAMGHEADEAEPQLDLVPPREESVLETGADEIGEHW